jgi:hypothetical protein
MSNTIINTDKHVCLLIRSENKVSGKSYSYSCPYRILKEIVTYT